jgi:hypothetical protein
MNNEPNDLEKHHRNQKALAYLDAIKAREEREEKAKCRLFGCLVVLAFNAILWLSIYIIFSILTN